MTKNEKYIVDMYVRYFGRAADAETIATYAEDKKTSVILKNIIADADAEKADLDTTEFVNNAFQNLFGRIANTKEMNKYSKVIEKGKNLPINSIVKSAAKADKAVYNNKKAVALKNAELGGAELDLSKISKGNLIDLKTVTTLADLQAKIDALPENSNVPSAFDGKTYTLTAGVDTGKDFVGTAKDDTFLATSAANWSVGDSIDGGKGVDTLKIIDTAAINITGVPVGGSLKNVEILDVISGGTVTANTTSIDGLTLLNITSKTTAAAPAGATNNSATASATTDIKVTDTNADASDNANTITVDGGKDVTVVSKNNGAGDSVTKDAITVGNTTAAAGKVSVTSTGDAAGTSKLGAITVNGGTEITVNQNAGNVVSTTNTGGAIAVNGNASTTTVTVNQSAINTATATVVGYAAGAVTIADTNATTAADTISTVTLKNYGASTIASNALSTLNLESTGATASGTLGLNITLADTTVLPTTLTVNSKGGSFGAVSGTMADKYTAVNINSSADTTIANAAFAANKTLTVDGAGVTTFTAFTAASNAALTSIVSNGAGLTIGTELATTVAVTGGAGVENIKIGATTKTVDLGAGDDIATISVTAMGAGGSLKGGAGNDTLVVNTNGSNIAGLPQISGFETLRVEGAAAQGTHNAHTFTALEVGTTTAASTFTNVAAGVGLTVLAAPTGGVTVTLADATGTADVFNLTLKSAGNLAAGTVALAGVETININSVDTDTSTASGLNANTLTLSATAAKSIVVTGNTDLALTNTTEVLVTSFDASAATGDITYTSANSTLAELVTIKGGAGDDILTGTATANDTIIGGAGADTLVYTGRADTFTGGAGNDTFDINALGTKALHLTITDLTKGDKIDLAAVTNDSGALSSFVTAKVTLGASATFDEYLNEAAKALTGGTDSIAKWFQFEGNTYLVNDNSNNATFTEGTDAVIKITGLVDLSTATYSTVTDTITIA